MSSSHRKFDHWSGEAGLVMKKRGFSVEMGCEMGCKHGNMYTLENERLESKIGSLLQMPHPFQLVDFWNVPC